MLSLTKKTDYALIAMAYLAERPSQFCSARQISQEYSLPLPVLMNILKTLNHEGLVVSTRGAKGGYKIADDPAKVSLARLIDAVEGPIRFVQCVGKGEDDLCVGSCPIRGPVLKLHRKLNDFLEAATLADVVVPGTEPASAGVGTESGVET
ncbi:MAG: Rrf2 family transcriptional regulator [Phycisphaerae bacterium]|nr:Rrf2 family transcriptional regulator [Phycisphaerae bacterium]